MKTILVKNFRLPVPPWANEFLTHSKKLATKWNYDLLLTPSLSLSHDISPRCSKMIGNLSLKYFCSDAINIIKPFYTVFSKRKRWSKTIFAEERSLCPSFKSASSSSLICTLLKKDSGNKLVAHSFAAASMILFLWSSGTRSISHTSLRTLFLCLFLCRWYASSLVSGWFCFVPHFSARKSRWTWIQIVQPTFLLDFTWHNISYLQNIHARFSSSRCTSFTLPTRTQCHFSREYFHRNPQHTRELYRVF